MYLRFGTQAESTSRPYNLAQHKGQRYHLKSQALTP